MRFQSREFPGHTTHLRGFKSNLSVLRSLSESPTPISFEINILQTDRHTLEPELLLLLLLMS